LAEFKQDVDVLRVFKEVLKSHNVVVVEGAVNFDFTHELLLGPRLGERILHDDLCSLNLFVFKVLKFIAFGKATLAKEFAFEVLFDADVAVEFDNFLFYNSLSFFFCTCILSHFS
jgi:hypothetical protein